MAPSQVRTHRRSEFRCPFLSANISDDLVSELAPTGETPANRFDDNLRSAHGPWLGRPAEPRRAMGACWSARSARKRPAPRSRCRHAVRCAPSAGSCDRAGGRARPPIDRRRPARDATPAPPPGRGTASRPCARRNPLSFAHQVGGQAKRVLGPHRRHICMSSPVSSEICRATAPIVRCIIRRRWGSSSPHLRSARIR